MMTKQSAGERLLAKLDADPVTNERVLAHIARSTSEGGHVAGRGAIKHSKRPQKYLEMCLVLEVMGDYGDWCDPLLRTAWAGLKRRCDIIKAFNERQLRREYLKWSATSRRIAERHATDPDSFGIWMGQ